MGAHPTFFKEPRQTAADRVAGHRRPTGYREPVVRRNASNSPDLALAKGRTRADEKIAKHAAEVEQIRVTRLAVWARSATCECCNDTEQETAQKHHKAAHEMHEVIPRSLTRGLPPAERFNEAIYMRACQPCHKALQAGVRLRLEWLTPHHMLGTYAIEEKDERGNWVEIRRWAPRPVSVAVGR